MSLYFMFSMVSIGSIENKTTEKC